jgi:carbonic anhydrase
MSLNPSRRGLLGYLGSTVAIAACPLCSAQAEETAHAAAGTAEHAPHWGYEGEVGPDKWGHLQADFQTCDLGREQTPIDLVKGIQAKIGTIRPRFADQKMTILNNGHTIQVNAAPGSFTEINGVRHDLVQFHFHHPSEHLLAGRRLDLELHFVHRSAAGNLAVLGIFVKPGRANVALAPIWAAMPPSEGQPVATGVTIHPAALLPASPHYFRYTGSLTTPPCSEGVSWTVYSNPIEASPEQIRRFAALFPMNARPVQSVNRRFLLENL